MAQKDKPHAQAVQHNSKKRKDAPSHSQEGRPASKKVRFDKNAASRDARTIISQSTDKAVKHGELDVDKFVKSREFEIRALEQGLISSKKALSKRAFQLVPKELRRRTASHNAKRVPKKLRERAKREMKDDNTPTVTARRRKPNSRMRLREETAKKLRALALKRSTKTATKTSQDVVVRPARPKQDKLADVPMPKVKYKKRQRNKSWLPTHIYHAKRARMTPPKEPLWKFAIPLTPNAKSYRATHRTAGERGTMSFDMSYISTVQLEGRYHSLFGLLTALDAASTIAQLRRPHRWKWIRGHRALNIDLYHRDHPDKLIAPATILWRGSPTLTDTTTFDTLDGTTGSLFIRVHPSAFMGLWEELVKVSKIVKPSVKLQDLRYEIGTIELVGPASTEALNAVLKQCDQAEGVHQLVSVTNAAVLPAGSVIGLEVLDPRLHLKQQRKRLKANTAVAPGSLSFDVADGLVDTALFDHAKRWAASTSLPSQKAINRRRSLATPGQDPPPSEKDPRIPVLLHTMPTEKKTSLAKWTLLLPWKCLVPFWYSLMYLPLSSGTQPRLGGLEEMRHLHLEYELPWFPADYPATAAGWQWEVQERKRLHEAWKRRPKSKRVSFDRLDLGREVKGELGQGWACDWSKVVRTTDEETPIVNHHTQQHTVSEPSAVSQVRIEHISRGVSHQCARIYRLPSTGDLRKQWLALHPLHGLPKRRTTALSKPPKDAPPHVVQRHLAESLLLPPQAGQEDWPICPSEEDLIGFVTSGNFDLGAGRGTAIGSVLAASVSQATTPESHLCIVRNSGQSIGRLATWKLI